jgi:DNA-binding transcriptional MerR regulator
MRTVDVARHAGYSVQHVRNLERDGVLPPATRTAAGYRIHTEIHVRSALAYRALRSEDVSTTLAARDASLAARSEALLEGAAALSAVISLATSGKERSC